MALPAHLPRARFAATVHRVTRLGTDPLSTAGSLMSGGRYNAPRALAVLYAALDEATAVAEVVRGLRLRGIDPTQYPPRAWWSYTLAIDLDDVLDLTNPQILDALGIGRGALTGADVSLPRSLASEARHAGYAAMLVPSAAVPGATNLVIFEEHIREHIIVTSSKPVDLRPEK